MIKIENIIHRFKLNLQTTNYACKNIRIREFVTQLCNMCTQYIHARTAALWQRIVDSLNRITSLIFARWHATQQKCNRLSNEWHFTNAANPDWHFWIIKVFYQLNCKIEWCLWQMERKSCSDMPENIVFIACGSYNPPTPMHFRMFGQCLQLFTLLIS